MQVKFTDTFGKSLEKMVNRQRWHWKAWDFVRYDFPRFLSNVWRFKKDLYSYRWYSGHGAVFPFMKTAIDNIADRVEKDGIEVDHSRLKKVEKMRRVSYLLECFIEDKFIELAEAELGELVLHDWEFEPCDDGSDNFRLIDKDTDEEKEHNSKVFERAREIESKLWIELWRTLQGQEISQFTMIADRIEGHKEKDEAYDSWFDGSGIRGWWD